MMKLLYCKTCGDIVRLTHTMRTCVCTDSSGYYINVIKALVSGPCLVLGFDNRSFYNAVHADLDEVDNGVEFTAFAIPESAISVERVGDK